MTPKVLLLDPDERRAGALRRAAKEAGLAVAWYPTLADLGSVARLGAFDAVAVREDLPVVSGRDVARYAAALFPALPVVTFAADADDARLLSTVSDVLERRDPAWSFACPSSTASGASSPSPAATGASRSTA